MGNRVRLIVAGILAISFLMSLPARAHERVPAAPRINQSGVETANIVDIADDSGGFVAQYAIRMYTLKEARNELHFHGRCDSACTLFLALPPQQTCVSPGAYFRFHAPSAATAEAIESVQTYMMKKYPRWVRSWILGQGGLSSQLITMDYAYASKFMRTCVA
jgi:hypothetical protein